MKTPKKSEITGQSYILTPELHILGYHGPEVVSTGEFSFCQKGFMNEVGCFNDVHILSEVLSTSKEGTGLTAVQLDVS
jgi:hypothetical protein